MKTTIRPTVLVLVAFAAACGSDDSGSGSCGEPLVGVACEQANGECTDLVCVSGDWRCAEDQTEVPLVPGNCGLPDDCGDPPEGVACQQENSECTDHACIDGIWYCADDEAEVAFTPENCSNA